MILYAAVIEWPSDLGEPPVLIASQDQSELIPQAIEAVRTECDALAADSRIMRAFRGAFAADPDNLIDLIAEYDGPFITFYEKEV